MDSYERAKRDLLYWGGTVIIAVAGLFLLCYIWSVATALMWYGYASPVPMPANRSTPDQPYCYRPPPWEQILTLIPQLFPVFVLGMLGLYMRSQATPL